VCESEQGFCVKAVWKPAAILWLSVWEFSFWHSSGGAEYPHKKFWSSSQNDNNDNNAWNQNFDNGNQNNNNKNNDNNVRAVRGFTQNKEVKPPLGMFEK
jgi:hypothetical protein